MKKPSEFRFGVGYRGWGKKHLKPRIELRKNSVYYHRFRLTCIFRRNTEILRRNTIKKNFLFVCYVEIRMEENCVEIRLVL
jgi:hypothetical protein